MVNAISRVTAGGLASSHAWLCSRDFQSPQQKEEACVKHEEEHEASRVELLEFSQGHLFVSEAASLCRAKPCGTQGSAFTWSCWRGERALGEQLWGLEVCEH